MGRGFKTKLGILIAVLVIVSFGVGIIVGNTTPISSKFASRLINKDVSSSRDLDFNLYWEVWDLLAEKYYKQPVSDQDRFYGSIKGMVGSLGDPYTAFMTPDETKRFQDDLDGAFQGIGIEIGVRNGVLSVIAPLANSPAERAGLVSGDVILKIDDMETSDMTLDDAVSKIRGNKGTSVKLLVLHKNEDEAREVTITRDDIEVKSVVTRYDSDVAIIEVSRFGDTTTDEFKTAVSEVRSKNVNRIVLDLRNDPGGFLQTSIDLAGVFIPDGTVVIQEYGNGEKKNYERAGDATLKDAKVVVLVNEGSASASEILAGALRDRRGIKLIGKKTYGKGSVQDVELLSDGSSVRITVAKWLTPNGISINENGLDPDIEVELTRENIDAGQDPQLDRAKEVVRGL